MKTTYADSSKSDSVTPPKFAEFKPEEEMIFEIRLDSKYMLERGLFAYCRDEKTLLPLGAICRLLEFPISANSNNGTAAGWFLSENRRFALDLTNRQIVSGEIRDTIEEGDFYCLSDDIYVNDKCLARWFPIKVESNIRELVVNVIPLEKLPIIQRMERESRWSSLRPSEKQALLPLQRSRYELFSSPVADLSLSSDFSKKAGGNIPTRYSINLANDMLYHTSQIYASGNDKDGLTAARMRMTWDEQSDDQKTWKGYNTYSFGDITPSGMPLIPSLRSGRGIYVSNTPVDYSSEFAFTTISGNLPEGWSAELYRGRSLLETISPQQSRDEMYFFENVPILTGNNEFIVKLYGPYGQIKEERQTLVVGSGMVSPQRTYYKLTALQNNKEMLPVQKFNTNRPEGYTLRSEITHGINNRLTLKHDFAGVIEDDKEYLYSTVEAIGSLPDFGSLPPINGSVGIVSQLDAGNALLVRSRTNFSGWNISNEFFNFYQDFSAATAQAETDWRNTLSLSGQLFAGQSISLKWLHDAFNIDRLSDSVNLGLSSRIGQTTLLNSFDHRSDRYSNRGDTVNTDGNTEIRTRVGEKCELSAGLNYLIRPESELRTLGIGGRWQEGDETSYTAQIRRNLFPSLNNKANTSFNFGFLKKFPEFSSGLQFSGDTVGDLRAMLTFDSSFAGFSDLRGFEASSESMLRSGGVIVTVTQRVKDGTIPLKDVEIMAGGRKARTDASGTAILRGLSPLRRVDVVIEPGSLVDPFLVTETPGVSIIPRPGVMQRLDYFVVMTSEIEGKVYFEGEAAARPVGGILLQIEEEVTGKVVDRTRSDSDGFYLFDFVRPGRYFVGIDAQQAENLGVYVTNRRLITVNDNGNVLSDQDIMLRNGSKREIDPGVDSETIRQLNIAPPIIMQVAVVAPQIKPEPEPENVSECEAIRQLNIAPPSIKQQADTAPTPIEPDVNAETEKCLNIEPPAIKTPAVVFDSQEMAVVVSPEIGRMLPVPAGFFQRDQRSGNISQVSAFYMSQFEITVEQYHKVLGMDAVVSDDGKLPAHNLSWYDAIVFCNRLSIIEGLTPAYRIRGYTDPEQWGKTPAWLNPVWDAVVCDWKSDGYRLPTESEWMWAAMGADSAAPRQFNFAGYKKPFAGSGFTSSRDDYAWYWADAGEKVHPVGTKLANELGFFDMSGNVSEWCWDLYQDAPLGATCDYRGPEVSPRRVERGGSHEFGEYYLKVAARASCEPFVKNVSGGLRIVRPLVIK